MQTFPELGLWRELREAIQARVWDTSNEPEPPPTPAPKPKSPSRHRSRSRGRGGGRRDRSRERDRRRNDDDANGDGRRHRDSERDRARENESFQPQPRDLAWESRWTTSDSPNRDFTKDCANEAETKRDHKAAIAIHPKMGVRACRWGKKWRSAIFSVLPSGMDSAAPHHDHDVRQLIYILWKDIVKWAARSDRAERVLGLFRADTQTCKTFGWESKADAVPRGLEPGTPPADWSFVPVSDILLVVGDGILGITVEGVFTDNVPGHKRLKLEKCFKQKGSHAKGKDGEAKEVKRKDGEDRQASAPSRSSKWDVSAG
jgi:hypothetical protein